MQQQFYMKETFYGDEVRVVFLPLEMINNNKRIKKGVKNLGFNEFKLRHNNIKGDKNATSGAGTTRTLVGVPSGVYPRGV